jgi:hypothetical protein
LTATVGDYVWSDLNADGIQDPNEPGIGGMLVTLFNSGGTPVGSAITDGTGHYLITNVPPGTGYYVTFSNTPNNPSGLQPSFTLQGGAGGTNTSHANALGVSNTFTVNAGDNITNIDAGVKDYPGRAILPVSRLELSAVLRGTTATINWITENEINTSRFYIERSLDNLIFSSVGNVAAAGTYTGVSRYNINDDLSGFSGVIYYRIKAMDIDGKFTYSNTVAVRISNVKEVKVWPNPFTDNISITLNSEANDQIKVTLMDYTGKTIQLNKYVVSRGNNQINVAGMKQLASGVYTIQISNTDGTTKYVQKLVKE